MLQLEIVPHSPETFIAPARGTSKSAGLDIFAQQDILITRVTGLLDLGFRASVPDGYFAMLLPRSGQGARYNVQLANTAGVIDSDYRDPWKAAIHLGDRGTDRTASLLIKRGTALAQMLILPVPQVGVSIVEALRDSDRKGGFGSTDKA